MTQPEKSFLAGTAVGPKCHPGLCFVWNDRERLMQRESTGENKFGRWNLKRSVWNVWARKVLGPARLSKWWNQRCTIRKRKKYFRVCNHSRIVFGSLAVKHVDRQEAKTDNNTKNQEQQNFKEYDKHLPLRDPASYLESTYLQQQSPINLRDPNPNLILFEKEFLFFVKGDERELKSQRVKIL